MPVRLLTLLPGGPNLYPVNPCVSAPLRDSAPHTACLQMDMNAWHPLDPVRDRHSNVPRSWNASIRSSVDESRPLPLTSCKCCIQRRLPDTTLLRTNTASSSGASIPACNEPYRYGSVRPIDHLTHFQPCAHLSWRVEASIFGRRTRSVPCPGGVRGLLGAELLAAAPRVASAGHARSSHLNR